MKYLIRSYEILLSVYGVEHPSVSAASSSVASLLCTAKRLPEAREWLGLTIRLMEGLHPFPHRAIAFARQQLANVLIKQNYRQEAIDVLCLVVQFYCTSVHTGIKKWRNQIPSNFTYNKQLWSDLHHYFNLTENIVDMYKSFNQMNLSLEHTLNMIDLCDMAFGWDSLEFGIKDIII